MIGGSKDESKIEDAITLDYLKLFAEKCWLNGRRSIHESLLNER
jgi:hypothetical protein